MSATSVSAIDTCTPLWEASLRVQPRMLATEAHVATATPLVPLSLGAGGAEYAEGRQRLHDDWCSGRRRAAHPWNQHLPGRPGVGSSGSPVAAARHAACGVEELLNPESPPSQSLFENP